LISFEKTPTQQLFLKLKVLQVARNNKVYYLKEKINVLKKNHKPNSLENAD